MSVHLSTPYVSYWPTLQNVSRGLTTYDMGHDEKYHSNIDYFRNIIGITVVELAKRSGLSRGYINEVKRGDKAASRDALIKLAVALNTTPARLIDADILEGAKIPSGDVFKKINSLEKTIKNLTEEVAFRSETKGFISKPKPTPKDKKV